MENLESKIKLVEASIEEKVAAFGDDYDVHFEMIESDKFDLLEDIVGEESNDVDGEILEIPNLRCSTNSVGKKVLYLGVNKNATTENARNVRSGAGTNYPIIGKLYPKECFSFTGSVKTVSNNDWYEIEFLDPSGKWRVGWYQGFNGAGYWKNNPYTSYTTRDHRGNNFSAKAYLVKSETKVWSYDKNFYFLIPAGEYVLCQSGAQGKTGSSEHSWMACNAITEYERTIDRLFVNKWITNDGVFTPFSNGIGYVDVGIKTSSRNPKVKGSW